MKLETFFEKFDQFADAPDAVAKMRELVLQLAVRGELVPQDPQDEPAAKAIERILAASGSGRTAKLFAEQKSKVLPFAVPSSWNWVRFGDLVRIRTGKLDANAAVEGGEFPFFTCSKTPSRIATYSFDTSAVILAGNGDFNLKSYSGKFDAYQRTYVIEPQGWELGFCFWLVSAQIKRITDNQRGSAIPYLRLGDIADPLVPFPPLAEQKRIVAKVDELMALCDQLEAQQQERETRHAALARASLARFADAPTPANLHFLFHPSYAISTADLRKSILTLAVQGKLVPQDPNDEPAEELLKRSLAERRKLKRTDATKMQALSAEEALGYDIPESWRWQQLDDLLVFGPTNGFSPKAVDYETPVRSLTLSATTSGRFKGEHSKFITTEVPSDSDLWLRDGDILVQRGNTIEYVGVAAIYRGQPHRFVYPDLMMKLRVSAAFDVGFIHLAMSHEAARDFLRARASGTSGSMPKINQTTLRRLPLPIPPLAEQRRIVAKVEQLMALVDALETQLAASRATAENLLAAVVAELTEGTHVSPAC